MPASNLSSLHLLYCCKKGWVRSFSYQFEQSLLRAYLHQLWSVPGAVRKVVSVTRL